ncbi:phage tail protein [Chromohalobacter israelensis]|uniref:phage tail protein n=1 Tax=Chromohalobacter israelensis TaxID=141390 RepID=UPI00265C7A2C|nr:phage tail protein [Chromohalobacter salexigens]MDO0945905.1 phage tail protein [Chromohalobacter salexigens]
MAHVPTVPNFSQWDFEYGDTDAAIIKDNARNAALVQFGGQLRQMTQTFNDDLETVAEDKAAAAQSASEAQTFRDEAQEISETGLPPKAGNAGAILRVADDEGSYILDKLLRHLLPVGEIKMFPATVAPEGFRKANGDEVSRTEYADLWAFAQASGNLAASEAEKDPVQFGPGDGSTTFTLPDYRGLHPRFWDDGRGIDPGREMGTTQESQNKAHDHGGNTRNDTHGHGGSIGQGGDHNHAGRTADDGNHRHPVPVRDGEDLTSPVQVEGGDAYGNSGTAYTDYAGMHWHYLQIESAGQHGHSLTINNNTHAHGINNDGGDEARPINVALLVCIRY